MAGYVTGETVRRLREKKGWTQKALAEGLCVSDKTVSKWETGRGLPDITLIEPLARALSVSVAELLSGDCVENKNKSGNMLKGCFYVCPMCGNVVFSSGEGAFCCCGISLPVQEAEAPDELHAISVSRVEDELYVRMEHPMTKTHHISFFALVMPDGAQIVKLYPEQEAETRFPVRRGAKLFAFCNRHGLYAVKLQP